MLMVIACFCQRWLKIQFINIKNYKQENSRDSSTLYDDKLESLYIRGSYENNKLNYQ